MIGDIAAGSALALVGAELGQKYTERNRAQDFANWNLARKSNFDDAQMAQKMAPVNTKLGMVMAGLDPSIMSSPPQAATPAPSPMQDKSMKPIELASAANLMADSKLKEQQAEKVELENDITKGENEGAENTYKEYGFAVANVLKENGFTSTADSILRDIDKVIDSGINVGHLRGAIQAYKTFDELQGRMYDSLDKVFNTKEVATRINNEAFKEIAKMPKLTRELTEKYIATQTSLALELSTASDVNKQRIDEIKKSIEKMNGEINLMVEQGKLSKAQAEFIRNGDWKSLMYDGELGKAAIAGGEKAAGKLLDVSTDIAKAAMFSRAVKGAKSAPNAVAGSEISTPKFSPTPTNKVKSFRTNKFEQSRQENNVNFENLYKRNSPDRKKVIKKYSKYKDIIDSPEFSNPDWYTNISKKVQIFL